MPNLSHSGLKLGSYKLFECIGRGAFGKVYRASDANNQTCAVKVANEKTESKADADSSSLLSVAIGLFSGAYNNVNPVPEKLLELQCKRSASAASLMPLTQGPFKTGNNAYICMEFIKGLTLRELLKQNLKVAQHVVNDLDLAIKVLEAICILRKSPLSYHGDLKPENIILSGNGVRLIDPGYFGALACEEGMIPQAVISTPQYYPFLEPDDSFAAGSIFWEICLGFRPIANVDSAANYESVNQTKELIGPGLQEMIAFQEMMGRYFLSPISGLSLPLERWPQLAPPLQDLLLRSIGLELSGEGLLERSKKPLAPEGLLDELKQLKQNGTSILNPKRAKA